MLSDEEFTALNAQNLNKSPCDAPWYRCFVYGGDLYQVWPRNANDKGQKCEERIVHIESNGVQAPSGREMADGTTFRRLKVPTEDLRAPGFARWERLGMEMGAIDLGAEDLKDRVEKYMARYENAINDIPSTSRGDADRQKKHRAVIEKSFQKPRDELKQSGEALQKRFDAVKVESDIEVWSSPSPPQSRS